MRVKLTLDGEACGGKTCIMRGSSRSQHSTYLTHTYTNTKHTHTGGCFLGVQHVHARKHTHKSIHAHTHTHTHPNWWVVSW